MIQDPTCSVMPFPLRCPRGPVCVCAFLLLVASLSDKHNTHQNTPTQINIHPHSGRKHEYSNVAVVFFSSSLLPCHLQISDRYWKNVLSFSDLFFLLYGGKNNQQNLNVLLLCEHSESAIVCHRTSLNVILLTSVNVDFIFNSYILSNFG